MNKFALVLVFSVFVFIKGQTTYTIDNFNTEPYHAFDWLDNDEETFKVQFILQSGQSLPNDMVCYLYNNSVACRMTCTPSSSTLECNVVGDDCRADKDNPAYKYYYAAYCGEKTTYSTSEPNPITRENNTEQLTKYLNEHSNYNGLDLGVTIAVSSGSFLKYSMILLSLLIL